MIQSGTEKIIFQSGMLVYAFNPATWEAKVGGL